MMRDNVSRPYWSVPSQCSAVGPRRRAGGSSATGSYGATHGANTAANVAMTMIAAPTPPAPRNIVNQTDGLAARTESADDVRVAAPSAIAHPRIDEPVDDVDEQVHDDERAGDEQHGPLYDG